MLGDLENLESLEFQDNKITIKLRRRLILNFPVLYALFNTYLQYDQYYKLNIRVC